VQNPAGASEEKNMTGSSTFGRKGRILAAAATLTMAHHSLAQFLSVDLNGGDVSTGNNLSTNEGWNGSSNQPVNGVTWTPWGGNAAQGGEGTNYLPFAPPGTTPNPVVLGLTHSFTTGAVTSGSLTIGMTAGGTAVSFNSRDRGSPSGSANFGDVYRDLVFLSRGNQQCGSNPIIFTISGLNANTTYNFTGYVYDNGSPGQMIFGVTNPALYDYADPGNVATGNYKDPPADLNASIAGPRTQWFAGDPPPSADNVTSSTFKVTSNANGVATFYEWSQSIAGGGQSAVVVNGFQLSNVTSSTWGSTTSTTWGNGNWTGGTPDGDGTVANFGTTAASQTVTIEGTGRTVGVMNIVTPNPYTFTGGTLTMSNAFTPDPNNPTTVGMAYINLNTPSVSINTQINSAMVLAHNTSINVAAASSSLTINGQISGPGGINLLGPGTVLLTNNNTYSGTTNVYGGRLILTGNQTNGGTYTLGAGVLLGGSGSTTSRVEAWNNSTLSPGTGGVGTLTVGTFAMGSPNPHGSGLVGLAINAGTAGVSDLLISNSNGLSFANTSGTLSIAVTNLGGMSAGQFPIIDYSGSILDASGNPVGDLSRFGLTTTTIGAFTLSLINNTANTSIDLLIGGGGPINSTWTGAAGANWSVNGNWTGTVPNSVDAQANFGTNAANQYAVTVDGAKTVGTVSFSGANSYTLSGSTITFQATNGAPAIVVGQGNHTISAPVTLNNYLFVTTATGASLTLSGTVTNTVSGQEISVSGGGTTSFSQLNLGTLLVNAGTTKIISKASIGNSAGTTHVGTLTVAASGATFDITNNYVIVDNTPVGTIGGQIQTAYANGAWTGTGITSSSAAAVAANAGNLHKMAVGYAVANQVNDFNANPGFTFGGIAPSPTSVLIAYTLSGDANLDGVVNTSDFMALSQNFGGTTKVWVQGDFNYDGKVNALDFNSIASNFGATATPGLALGTLVPEPSTLCMVVAPALLFRRRRHAK
jgi:autotransporter-associated beta strand protein